MIASISIITALSIVSFFVGAVLMIPKKMRKKGVKLFAASIVIFAVCVVTSLFFNEDDKPSSDNSNSKASDSIYLTKDDEEALASAQSSANQETLKTKIKSSAKPQIGKVEEVDINDDTGKNDGGKIVLIHIKSNEATKRVALYQTSLIMSKEFKIKKVNEVVVFWDADVVDKYGKKSVGTLAKVGLTKSVAKKIQWDSFDYTQYPNITDNYYMSKLLK
ncbi:hypothetical protein [Sporolactobacillus terrae]|uniref:hypothetical protein n=1 Tax=Sporolactobacillus terrae TaxID=269673 RepID=UPI00048C00D2|nr:hypothetical protein [Sporolactobacillus terrae]UAK17599.1 hypothetical protein K7399_06645 [Sporolactobacillus terrae]